MVTTSPNVSSKALESLLRTFTSVLLPLSWVRLEVRLGLVLGCFVPIIMLFEHVQGGQWIQFNYSLSNEDRARAKVTKVGKPRKALDIEPEK